MTSESEDLKKQVRLTFASLPFVAPPSPLRFASLSLLLVELTRGAVQNSDLKATVDELTKKLEELKASD